VSTSQATSSTSAWLYVALRPSSLTVKLENRTSAAYAKTYGARQIRCGSHIHPLMCICAQQNKHSGLQRHQHRD